MNKCASCDADLDNDDSTYCSACEDELAPPPKGEECEFCCEREATIYLQDHAVCDECFSDAVESLGRD